jgi:hypothetical protein
MQRCSTSRWASYGFPLATQTPPPHFRLEGMVTSGLPLLGGPTGGFCLAVPSVEPGVAALPVTPVVVLGSEPGLGGLPIVGGFVTEADVVAPPIAVAGLEAPPIAFGFVFAGPPSAFCAKVGCAALTASAPIEMPSSKMLVVVRFFIDCESSLPPSGISAHHA